MKIQLMNTKKNLIWITMFFLAGLTLLSCVKENSPYIKQPVKGVPIVITFSNLVNKRPLKLDTLNYATSLGYRYMVNDLQYFVSTLRLHQKDKKWLDIGAGAEVHYVDARIPGSEQWSLSVFLPEAEVDSLSFVFGLDADNNISNRFPDPPERDMFWPEVLGGGYHYMKMNLKWDKPGVSELKPFMYHLGIGQMYAGNSIEPDSIIGFIQNYFIVSLPFKFRLQDGVSKPFAMICMNIERWFDGVYAFDFEDYPKGIMQNQEGMFKASSNGRKVFSIPYSMN
jgi:hypothetical protein